MIREWLERRGWTCVRSDDEGELYTKGNPVCMNTAAALFQEALDFDSRVKRLLEANNEEVERRRAAERKEEAVMKILSGVIRAVEDLQAELRKEKARGR
jgi:hypothetical protein